MKTILFLLLFYTGAITIEYMKLRKKNKINYSNYKNCLKALASYDKELAEYLERNK